MPCALPQNACIRHAAQCTLDLTALQQEPLIDADFPDGLPSIAPILARLRAPIALIDAHALVPTCLMQYASRAQAVEREVCDCLRWRCVELTYMLAFILHADSARRPLLAAAPLLQALDDAMRDADVLTRGEDLVQYEPVRQSCIVMASRSAGCGQCSAGGIDDCARCVVAVRARADTGRGAERGASAGTHVLRRDGPLDLSAAAGERRPHQPGRPQPRLPVHIC